MINTQDNLDNDFVIVKQKERKTEMATNELVKANSMVPQINTPDAEKFIKTYICQKAQTQDLKEIQMQLVANGYNLMDVISKRVHVVPFMSAGTVKYTIVVSIHEMIAKADATGTLDGIEVTSDGGDKQHPTWAQTTVWKKGCSHPFTKKVFWSEYFRPNIAMWVNKPTTMLEKTSTAHALRLAGYTNLFEESEIEEIQDVRYSEEAIAGLPATTKPNDPTVPHNHEEKIEFLKKCDMAYRWFEKHKVERERYDRVLGDLGFEKPEQITDLDTMNKVAGEYQQIMRDIIAAGTHKLGKEAA
mgnify:CR=1 FL=1